MKQSELMNILDDVATGKVTKEEALLAIKEEPFKDRGLQRLIPTEASDRVCLKLFMAAGKTKEQIKENCQVSTKKW